MPRKSCCCNPPPPPGGSCCRPIYSGCVGKEYEFSVLMKIKYPCYKTTSYVQKEFVCPNNPAKVYPIQNDLETFRLTVKYRITEPAYQNIPAACLVQYNPTRRCDECDPFGDPFYCTNNCGDAEAHPITPVQSYPCNSTDFGVYPGPFGYLGLTPTSCLPQSFLPSNYLTWPLFSGNPISGCDCLNGKYPTCDFSELKPCDQLDTGDSAGAYRCEGLAGIRFYLPGETPVCPNDPFGNPTTVVIISEPVEPNFFHANCYNYWRLQKPNFGFIPYPNGVLGCTITNHGEVDISNVADSYTIQFIPDPNVPEQNDPNYTPKIQPKLIFFQVLCNRIGAFNNDGFGIRGEFLTPTNNNNDNYGIFLKMGFGYRAEFCCDSGSGTGPNPNNPDDCNNIEVVDIPFREFKDWFTGATTTQGMAVFMAYGRSSLPNDPMNLCIPTSTQNVPNLSCTPQTCDTGSAYYDDYNACYKGNPTVGFSVSDPQDPFDPPNPNLWIYNDYCDPVFIGDIGTSNDWPLCNHVRFDYRMDVDRTV